VAIGIALVIGAYLLGSIPTGFLIAKAFGIDIRATGSGNIGATNVYRSLGRKVGIITLLGDCLKGLIPILAVRYMQLPDIWVAATGLAAFFGHVYTVFLRFKGGKGVATALGVFIGISPVSVVAAVAIFIIVLLKWRYVSLASISAAAAIPFIIAFIEKKEVLIAMSLVIAAIIIFRHSENIRRLKNGTENVFRS